MHWFAAWSVTGIGTASLRAFSRPPGRRNGLDGCGRACWSLDTQPWWVVRPLHISTSCARSPRQSTFGRRRTPRDNAIRGCFIARREPGGASLPGSVWSRQPWTCARRGVPTRSPQSWHLHCRSAGPLRPGCDHWLSPRRPFVTADSSLPCSGTWVLARRVHLRCGTCATSSVRMVYPWVIGRSASVPEQERTSGTSPISCSWNWTAASDTWEAVSGVTGPGTTTTPWPTSPPSATAGTMSSSDHARWRGRWAKRWSGGAGWAHPTGAGRAAGDAPTVGEQSGALTSTIVLQPSDGTRSRLSLRTCGGTPACHPAGCGHDRPGSCRR